MWIKNALDRCTSASAVWMDKEKLISYRHDIPTSSEISFANRLSPKLSIYRKKTKGIFQYSSFAELDTHELQIVSFPA